MKNTIMTGILTALLLTGCSSAQTKQQEREREAQIQRQEPADTPSELAGRAAMAFANAPNLTPEQKLRLSEIYSRVYTEAQKIRREMGKTKSLLFMTLAKADYKSKEIADLKSRIVVLDQERLILMFEALEDVQAVVGQGVEAEKIYKHFREYEQPGRIRDYE